MARLLRSLRQALGLVSSSSPSSPISRFSASVDTDFSVFREGDRALILGKSERLTDPLQKGGKTNAPSGGHLSHDQIIGRAIRQRYQSNKGRKFWLRLPTLEEYVSLTPRLVTPIYAADTNLIVSLLDIHVTAPSASNDEQPPLEILESGTGHGSLTLQLSRAIQAANPLAPPMPSKSRITYLKGRPVRPDEPQSNPESTAQSTEQEIDPVQEQWDTWRAQRRAIIHTVDVSGKFSAHAESIVRGFRRGIYAGNVDFYVGHVENWIQDQIKRRSPPSSLISLFGSKQRTQPFLTHAILDMPSASLRVKHVAEILKPEGTLVVFAPSITQLGECERLIHDQTLPLTAVKFVELGTGISGGREWDVRLAVKKSRADPSGWETPEPDTETETPAEESSTPSLENAVEEAQTQTQAAAETETEPETVLVCRPRVGAKVVGGGFVGIWRRKVDRNE
ncbi:S-adenosyl-L-methionine-dependent methyltransferase [Aspergillus crustosus]